MQSRFKRKIFQRSISLLHMNYVHVICYFVNYLGDRTGRPGRPLADVRLPTGPQSLV